MQFKYVAALDGIQSILEFTDRIPPELIISPLDDDTYQITSNEALWQDMPYVAAQYANADSEYKEHITAILPAGTNTWNATVPAQIVVTPPPPLPVQYTPVGVTASGQHTAAGGAATNAIDGNTSTWWDSAIDLGGGGHGGQVPAWIQLELEDVETITKMDIHFYDNAPRSYTYYVEGSVNGSDWNEIVPATTRQGLVSHEFTPSVDLHYVRITVTNNTENAWAHIKRNSTLWYPDAGSGASR